MARSAAATPRHAETSRIAAGEVVAYRGRLDAGRVFRAATRIIEASGT